MTINRTTLLDLPLPVTGTESGVWGDVVNNGLSQYIDISVAGSLSLSADSDTNLSSTEGDASATNIGSTTAQYAILRCTGARTATRNINAPAWAISGGTLTNYSKIYIVVNETTGSQNIVLRATNSATPTYTTGVTIVPGERAVCAWNGSDFVKVGGAAGGSTTQIQFNNAGVFGGSANLTWDGTNVQIGATGALRLADTDSSNYVAFKSPGTVASNVTWTLPSVDGTNGQALTTNGSGTLAFSSVTTSPGGSTTQVQYNNAGAFAGSSNLTFDGTNLTVGGTATATKLIPTGNVTAGNGMYLPTTNTLAFSTNGSERMRIDSAGVLTAAAASTVASNWPTGTSQIFKLNGATYAGISFGDPEIAGAANRAAVSITAWSGAGSNYYTSKLTTLGDGTLTFSTQATASTDAAGTSTERMRINASGNVGIGTSSPSYRFDVSGASASGIARFANAWGDGTNPAILVDGTGGDGRLVQIKSGGTRSWPLLWVTASTTDVLVVNGDSTIKTAGTISVGGATPSTSGAGITFPATQSASTDANTLDDYEEGTWTLTVTAGSGSFTSITSTAGYYTKVGNLVSAYGRIKIGTNGTAATDVRVSGLPFSSASGVTRYAGSGLEGDQVGFSLNVFILQSTDLIYLQKYDGTYPGGTSYGLDFTITYRT